MIIANSGEIGLFLRRARLVRSERCVARLERIDIELTTADDILEVRAVIFLFLVSNALRILGEGCYPLYDYAGS